MTVERGEFDVAADVSEALREAATIMCIVDTHDDPDLRRAHRAALELAVAHDAALLLYDRSGETWGETDHSHLVEADDVDHDAEPRLAALIEAAAAAEIEVSVWRSVMPSIATGVMNAVQNGRADVIVVPESGGVHTITDRVLDGGPDLAGAVAAVFDKPVADDAGASVPVVVVSESDQVRLAASAVSDT